MKSISVDFDGVIHSYTSEFTKPYVISDPPVPGAIEWLTEMTNHFHVKIFTARVSSDTYKIDVIKSIRAILSWLEEHGMDRVTRDKLQFAVEKPHATMFIDDRSHHFKGPDTFPTAQEIKAFKPWNR